MKSLQQHFPFPQISFPTGSETEEKKKESILFVLRVFISQDLFFIHFLVQFLCSSPGASRPFPSSLYSLVLPPFVCSPLVYSPFVSFSFYHLAAHLSPRFFLSSNASFLLHSPFPSRRFVWIDIVFFFLLVSLLQNYICITLYCREKKRRD